MNKKILFVLGIVSLILLITVWVYFFFIAPPNDGGIFVQFGGGSSDQIPDESNVVDTTNQDNERVPANILGQITTRPVAGMGFSGDVVRFVEQGTGHVYEIDLNSRNETQISGTTITRVSDAVFSPNGNRVILTSIDDRGISQTFVGTITKNDQGDGVLDGITLSGEVHGAVFSEDGDEVLYVRKNESNSTGHAYNVTEQTTRRLFNIPLRDFYVTWGKNKTYVITSPSTVAFGNVYEVSGDTLAYVRPAAPSLTAFAHENGIIVNSLTDTSTYVSTSYEADGVYNLPGVLLPEKCTGINDGALVCAQPESTFRGFVDSWYKGIFNSNDNLWVVDTDAEQAALILDIGTSAGQVVDVNGVVSNDQKDVFLLRNKIDNSLWLYDPKAGN